eukprot:comp17249_c0_seq1/m.16298 comp17249_c0_seq1/g.16298  ORF comp17249_c0_seq1/g.16298 comp17249_c0_seq1/m.16298 type:complete len:192 (+) comp17249_c0_seq1:581-1156(+)
MVWPSLAVPTRAPSLVALVPPPTQPPLAPAPKNPPVVSGGSDVRRLRPRATVADSMVWYSSRPSDIVAAEPGTCLAGGFFQPSFSKETPLLAGLEPLRTLSLLLADIVPLAVLGPPLVCKLTLLLLPAPTPEIWEIWGFGDIFWVVWEESEDRLTGVVAVVAVEIICWPSENLPCRGSCREIAVGVGGSDV